LLEAEVSPESVVEIKGGLGLIVAIASSSKRGDQVALLTDGREGGGSLKEVGERVASLGAVSLGKEAWDLYRIARGIPGTGTEISEKHNPYDVALTDLVSYTKGCYVGQEVIARLDTYQKARKTLFGVRCSERPAGLELPVSLHKNAVQVGVCTSLSGSPFLGEHLGLAVLQQDAVIEGDLLSIVGLDQDVSCVVSLIPMEFASG
jgi:folate-binding protein YgfZ